MSNRENILARPVYIDLLIIGFCVFFFTKGWLDKGLPGADFPGNLAWFWEIRESLFHTYDFSYWNPFCFNGGSRILIVSKLLGFLLPIPFSFLGEIYAIKAAVVLFHVLSGFGMYGFIKYLAKDQDASLLGALCYCLHPLYLMESALHGHMEVSFYYAFVPLIFWLYLKCLREKDLFFNLLCGVVIFLGFWVNNEGSFVTLPFLLLIYFTESWPAGQNIKQQLHEYPKHITANLWPSIIVVVTFIGLGAFFIIPGLVDRIYHSFFTEDYVRQSIKDFSFRNPLHLINRDSKLFQNIGDLDPSMRAFGGMLYLGAFPLFIIFVASLTLRKLNHKFALTLFAILISSYAFGFGGYSILDGLHLLIISPSGFKILVMVILFILLLYLLPAILNKLGMYYLIHSYFKIQNPNRNNAPSTLFWIVIVAVLIVITIIPLFKVLRTIIPLYAHVRNPLWFYLTPGMFAFSTLFALSIPNIKRALNPNIYTFFAPVCLMLLIIDFKPYTKYFYEQIPYNQYNELRSTFSIPQQDEDYFHTLGIESYNPLVDAGAMFSNKPMSWGWLNWSAPKYTNHYILQHLYSCICSPDAKLNQRGAVLAGIANIKYIIDDKAETPHMPPNETFILGGQSGRFAVFENPFYQPAVRFFSKAALYVGPPDKNLFSLIEYLETKNIFLATTENPGEYDIDQFDYIFWNKPYEHTDELPAEYRKLEKQKLINMLAQEKVELPEADIPSVHYRWERTNATQIYIECDESSSSGTLWVRLSESWYPHWSIKTDGEKHGILRVSWAFQGAKIDSNSSTIMFQYESPVYYKLGMLISLLCGIIIFYILIRLFIQAVRQVYLLPQDARIEIINKLPTRPAAELSTEYTISSLALTLLQIQSLRQKQANIQSTAVQSISPPISNASAFTVLDYALIGTSISIILIIYILTLAPTVTGEDAGELIAAAYALGVPHPPGYPVWTVSGKLFSLLPAQGDVAYRVNFMSAFYSILTLLLLYLIIRRSLKSALASFSAVTLFGITHTLWSQSTIAEVYTLNSYFTLLTFALLLYWQDTRKDYCLYLFAFAYGIGVTCHYMILLLAPVYAGFILYNDRHYLHKPKKLFGMIFLFILGLSPFLLIILFAQQQTGMNWGDPSNIERFLDHVRRVQYRGLEFTKIVTLADKLKYMLNLVKETHEQYPIYLLWLVIPGVGLLWKRHRAFFIITLAIAIMNAVVLTWLLQFKYNEENLKRVEVYYLPAYAMLTIYLAFGFSWLFEKIRGSISNQKIVLAFSTFVIVICSALLLNRNYFSNDKSRYYFAEDYLNNLFLTMEPNAICFPIGDHQTFPLIYAQVVDKKRPDVLIGDKYGFLEQEVYAEYEKLTGKSTTAATREEIEDALIMLSERPLYFFRRRPMFHLPGRELYPVGVLHKVFRFNEKSFDTKVLDFMAELKRINEILWSEYQQRHVYDDSVYQDSMARAITSTYPYYKGEQMLLTGNLQLAKKYFKTAILLEGESAHIYNNIGSALAQAGYPEEAHEYFIEALKINRNYFHARINLANIYETQGIYDKARFQLSKAMELEPDNHQLHIRWQQLIQKQSNQATERKNKSE